jgi:FKBP-type peptidyl-prolyl cis-trans isomerase FkpA
MPTQPSGLAYEDTTVGNGATAQAGREVTVHYTGWLHDASAPQQRGRKFDSSKTATTRSASTSAAGW